MTGLSFLTVHGRTKDQRSEPVNLEAIKLIKQSVRIPVVANGDVCSIEDAERVQELTGVDGISRIHPAITSRNSIENFLPSSGVMAARGILANPGNL